MPFVHHVVEQWGCGCTIQDNKGLNERTRRHPIIKPMSKLMCVGPRGGEQGKVLNRDDHKGLNEMNQMFDMNINDKLTFNLYINVHMWGKRLQVKVESMLKRWEQVWGFNHGQLQKPIKWEGENVLPMHDRKGLGKCKVRAPYLHKRLGVDKGNQQVVCDLLEWEG